MPVCVLSPHFVFVRFQFPPFVTRAIVSRLTAARALRAPYRVTGRAAPVWSHTFLGISFHILIAILCIASLFSVPAAASPVTSGSRLLNATECSSRWRCAFPPSPRCVPVLRTVTESCHRARFRRHPVNATEHRLSVSARIRRRPDERRRIAVYQRQCWLHAFCSTCLLCVLHFVLVCRFVVIIYRPDLFKTVFKTHRKFPLIQ